MSNEFGKMNFDPIPVAGSTRPELPKVPDLPPSKPTAKAPPATAELPTVPVLATPTAWLPESVSNLFTPTRTKGVLAAGVVSLVGGAATMNYIWPPKQPATTAQVQPTPSAPLPDATPATPVEPPPEIPKVGSVVVPLVTATVPPAISAVPEIKLPPLGGELPASTIPAPTAIKLPEILSTSGTEPMVPAAKPNELKLPDIAGTGAASQPMAATLPLPALPGVPAPSSVPAKPVIAELPKPEVKLELPAIAPLTLVETPKPELPKPEPAKDSKDLVPPLIPIPVTGASSPLPKLPEIGLPPLTGVGAVPAIDPKIELKTEMAQSFPDPIPKTTLVPEVPKLTAIPASASTVAPRTDYDVDLHYVKAGDSWAAISKQHFGDERYAEALKGYNQNASLAQVQRAEVPPIHVLRKNYASLIGKPVEKSGEWGAIATSSATEPKRSITGNGYKIYVVPTGGRTLKEIAADAFGDEGRWGMVWDTNPKLVPDKTVPEGTKVYLHSQSKIGE